MAERIEAPEAQKPDRERINRILRLMEHSWKMAEDETFGELLARLILRQPDEPVLLTEITDESLEDLLRSHLQHVMRSGRDA